MIYLIYYKIPKNVFNKTHGFSFLRNQHNAEFSQKYNFWFGLYGWTKKKKIIKIFKKTRNMNYFEIKKIEDDTDTMSDLEEKNMKRMEIKIFPMTSVIDMKNRVIEFPITKEEYGICSCNDPDESSELIEILLSSLDTSVFINPTVFNHAILTALSLLGFIDLYCYLSDDGFSDIPEVVDMHAMISETAAYNASFNMGYRNNQRSAIKFGMFEIYTMLFGNLLKEVK